MKDFLKILKTGDEDALRNVEVLTPKTIKELDAILIALDSRQHDYGTCVYAMSIAATAAFNYMAHKLGVTGFQASCADLDIIKRTRGIDAPFAIINANDMLYPQYNILERVHELLASWRPWAKEEAHKKLAEDTEGVHPDVLNRWTELAGENK